MINRLPAGCGECTGAILGYRFHIRTIRGTGSRFSDKCHTGLSRLRDVVGDVLPQQRPWRLNRREDLCQPSALTSVVVTICGPRPELQSIVCSGADTDSRDRYNGSRGKFSVRLTPAQSPSSENTDRGPHRDKRRYLFSS